MAGWSLTWKTVTRQPASLPAVAGRQVDVVASQGGVCGVNVHYGVAIPGSLSSKIHILTRRQRASIDGAFLLGDRRYVSCEAMSSPLDNGDADDEEEMKQQQIQMEFPRRSMLVGFTCNKCGARTERLVNPVAWEKGMVIMQCENCKAWHKVADAANMVEEYIFSDEE